ncbi:CYTH domain-containing protein [Conexibacter sp. W3-3-2]|uniref:class IV adenylate cyclase n=1 Tax=Conexibacter sp. W3-3-2 TaxID=2675227 RepID=UPI0012BA161D|nr:class IV adenylate cyclase [Conexibacter sp. W3-3-2]MTD45237.1 CYTH domain-containing protein [Conexibacter sp. W3-3-2]
MIPPAAPRRNVELKAHDPDPVSTLAAVRDTGAVSMGTLEQADTYFPVPHGRLKLRDEGPRGATLISYDRPREARARPSSYRLVPVPDPASLRAALAQALGESGTVVKSRRLLMHGAVRIHLDRIEGLGDFVELEAVAPPDSDLQAEHAAVDALARALGITPDRVVDRGYAELLGIHD